MNTRCNIEKQNCLGRPSPNLDDAFARNASAAGGTGEGGFRRGLSTVIPGNYIVKLTVGDKVYSKPPVIKMDPRVKP